MMKQQELERQVKGKNRISNIQYNFVLQNYP